MSPLLVVLQIGPSLNRQRFSYLVFGFIISIFVLLISQILFQSKGDFSGVSLRQNVRDVLLFGTFNEILRYPSILITQFMVIKIFSKQTKTLETEQNNKRKVINDNHLEWMSRSIYDPLGIGAYFGVGWGSGYTFVYYILPAFEKMQSNNLFDFNWHMYQVTYSITNVIGNVAITYMALVISVNRSIFRITIGLHLLSDLTMVVFTYFEPTRISGILVAFFTRFALVLMVYFLLRPKIRYISPAVLFFLLVVMFLAFILAGTFTLLFIWIIQQLQGLIVF